MTLTLTLFIHPLASFCHKVLIALYETGIPFTKQLVDLADPASNAALLEHWPVGKIPVLQDAARSRTIPETSIIIDDLQRHYPGRAAMLPQEPDRRLEVRLWDRFFDLYVSVPMQKIVLDRIRPDGASDPHGVAEARASLATAYAMIGQQVAALDWAVGPDFTMADCSAAPALFFATIVLPPEARFHNLAAYFERLMARTSVARTINDARPYFSMFPYVDAMPRRFRDG